VFSLFKFVLNRARHYWQLLFTLCLGVMLATTLLASGPMLVNSLIVTGLQLTLQGSNSADSNLLLIASIPADRSHFQQLDQQVRALLGQTLGLHQQRVTVSVKTPWLFPWTGHQISTSQRVDLAFYENIQEQTDFIAGGWPAATSPEPGVIRAVISEGIARSFKLHVGDHLPLSLNASENTPQLWLEVTGIARLRNSRDPSWFGEFSPFSSMQAADGASLYQAIIPQEIFFTVTPSLFPNDDLEMMWHVLVDPLTFTSTNISPFQAQLDGLKAQLASFQPSVRLETGLIDILKNFQVQFETIRLPVYILIAEIMLLVLYYVSMMAELSVRQKEREFATLYSRGFSTRQISAGHLLEALVILTITFFCGPWLGFGLVRIFSRIGPLGAVAQPGWGFILNRDVWIAAGIGALVCLAGLVLPLGPALRRSVIVYQQTISRDTRPPWWQRTNLDVFVLCAGLGLFWRLEQYGVMLVSGPDGARLDWLLLLSPLVLSVGAAMLLLRIFPILLEILASLAARGSGLLSPLALWQSARNPAHATRLVLLLTLAFALGIYSVSLNLTLTQNEIDRANYQVGKDLRLSTQDAIPLTELLSMPGVRQLSAAWRGEGTISVGPSSSAFELLAIEPASFLTTANLRRDFADEDMATLLAHLSIAEGKNPSLLLLPGQPARFGLWLWGTPDNKAELDSYKRWIDGDSDAERVGVTAKLQSAQGELFTVPLKRADANGQGSLPPELFTLKTNLNGRDVTLGIRLRPENNGWYYFEGSLPDLPHSSYPLSLQSLWFQNQATRLGEPIAKGISLVADDFTVVDALTKKSQIIEGFESLDRTVFLTTMNGSLYYGIFSSVTERASHSGAWGQSISMNNPLPMQLFPLRLRRTWAQEPLPALAGDTFLNATKLKVGDVVRASINGMEIDFQVAGALHYFPTMNDQSRNGYLVTSRDLLLPLLNEKQEAPINPNEVFVDSGGTLPLERLSTIMPVASQGWSSENIRKILSANPLALGLRSAAFFSFAIAALLSLLGFSTYFYLSIRRHETLYGIMRALGISVRQLYAWIVLEQVILILASLILGTTLGLLLNQITLPRLPVSLGEGLSIPPFVPKTDWLAIGQLFLGLLLAFLIVIAIVTALLWRVHLERVLRMSEES
jgi:hypothetical protein